MTGAADESQIWRLKFAALGNAHYHKARQRRLDAWARIANFSVIALGTTASADLISAGILIGPQQGTKAVIGFFVALIGTLQLVYDWSGRARTHDFLQRRYFEILAKIEELPKSEATSINSIDAELVRAYADEPPTLRALDSIAYNETLDSLATWPGASKDRLVIRWWQALFKHVCAFQTVHFPTISEREKAIAERRQQTQAIKEKNNVPRQ